MIEPTPPRRAFLADTALPHPRTVGWFGTTAVAMGGIAATCAEAFRPCSPVLANQRLPAKLRQAPRKSVLAAVPQPG